MFGAVVGTLASSPIRLRRYTWALAGFWTLAIGIVLLWEISDERQQAIDIARSEALGAWKKEAVVFRWAADTGRIYVPVTKKTPPDANLSSWSRFRTGTITGKRSMCGANDVDQGRS
jgi:hypothetical protein